MTESSIKPTDIKLHQKSRLLEISFEDGKTFKLPCEYLRCFSPFCCGSMMATIPVSFRGRPCMNLVKTRKNIGPSTWKN